MMYIHKTYVCARVCLGYNCLFCRPVEVDRKYSRVQWSYISFQTSVNCMKTRMDGYLDLPDCRLVIQDLCQ